MKTLTGKYPRVFVQAQGCVPCTLATWAMTKQVGHAAHSVLWPGRMWCAERTLPDAQSYKDGQVSGTKWRLRRPTGRTHQFLGEWTHA